MPSAEEIKEFSENKNPELSHVNGEENIRVTALQALYRKVGKDGEVEAQSSFSRGTKSPQGGEAIDEDTVICAGSVTKMFTSAALLKLWDQELAQKKSGELTVKNFPQGMETKLSSFMDGLKAKFPDCEYLATIEKAPHFAQVTLRDLLSHTHALGSRDEEVLAQKLMDDPNKQFSCADLVQFSQYNPKDKFGEFKYSNLGTELAGMIMELVSQKTYGEVLQEAVLDQVGADKTSMKAPLKDGENFAVGYCYITPMQMGEGDARKEYSGEINYNTSGNSVAAGGVKTTPADADKFIRKFLAKEAGDSSLFQNPEVVEALWHNDGKGQKHSYLGVNDFGDGTFGHNGHNGASIAGLKYNPDTKESYYYAAAGETLTYSVAYETLAQNKTGVAIKDDAVFARQEELVKVGYDFAVIKDMVDQNGFTKTAENLNVVLEKIAESERGQGREAVGHFTQKVLKEEGESKLKPMDKGFVA